MAITEEIELSTEIQLVTDDDKLDYIVHTLAYIVATFQRFEPMLQRYEQAANAGSFLKARKIIKETNGNGR